VLLSAWVFLLLRELLKDLAMLQLKRSQKSEQEPMVRCLMRILSTTSTSRWLMKTNRPTLLKKRTEMETW